MRYILLIFTFFCFIPFFTQAQQKPDEIKTGKGLLKIWPVMHASIVMNWDNKVIYVDPAQKTELFTNYPAPDLILITDIHGDHMDPKVLEAIDKKGAIIVAPQAVADKLPGNLKKKLVVLDNNAKTTQEGVEISAIPMYNLPEATDAMHTKGRGNGYILSLGGKRIYISGDTEDTPEMRALKNIDIAFVCMNLPYTMDINQAASGVLAFKPAIVYPYHHRGQDISSFKKLVNAKDPKIEVRIRNWYPE